MRVRNYVAEFIGTFMLVFFGCGTAMLVGCDSSFGAGYILTALAFGFILTVIAYSIGNNSGGHVNPAVSLAVLLTGGIGFVDFIGYIVAQFCGGFVGAFLLKELWSFGGLEDKTGALGSNGLVPSGDTFATFCFELILTAVFVLAILCISKFVKNKTVAGLVAGLSLTVVHILGIGITGTSVNPARSLGPALFAGGLHSSIVWVFILGPIAGALLAVIIFRVLIWVKGYDENGKKIVIPFDNPDINGSRYPYDIFNQPEEQPTKVEDNLKTSKDVTNSEDEELKNDNPENVNNSETEEVKTDEAKTE